MLRPALVSLCLLLAGPAAADPNPRPSEDWKTDFSKTAVDLGEIISGGPPRDGIPPIDNPVFVPVAAAEYDEREPVIVYQHLAEARAYPLSVLTWHEIVNDVVSDKPVTITYCPLCNAAIVFARDFEGKVLDFGTTGRLRNSDLIMYDRQTETWWQQFSGRAIIGELTGSKLTMLPSTTIPFATFVERHPEGKVLVPNNPSMRRYGANPYAFYDTADRPFLYRGDLPEGIDPMERVVIVEGEGDPFIVTVSAVREAGSVSKQDVSIRWEAGMASALDSPSIAKGRDVGHVAVMRDGSPAVHHVTFAFVAYAFHPEVEIAVE